MLGAHALLLPLLRFLMDLYMFFKRFMLTLLTGSVLVPDLCSWSSGAIIEGFLFDIIDNYVFHPENRLPP